MRNLRRAAAIILLPSWLTGCVQWRTQPAAPLDYIAQNRPGKVMLVMADSTTMRMRDPRILRDSVVGDQDVGNTNRRVAVPAADVVSVMTSQISLGKTALAGAAIAGGVLVLVLLSNAANNTVYY